MTEAPCKIGDVVHYIERGENNVVTFHPYVVCGIALIDNVWYAIDKDRGFNPCNTRWCVIGFKERQTKNGFKT